MLAIAFGLEETDSRYREQLRVYSICSYGQLTWGDPPDSGLDVRLTTPYHKRENNFLQYVTRASL
jgi:hypothetical protein